MNTSAEHHPLQPTTTLISLPAAGLISLADLSTLAQRTALAGTSSLLDCLVLAPGIHRQQHATRLNGGEYPACAAMTSGYVFRVENPATVFFLQQHARTGALTTMRVAGAPCPPSRRSHRFLFSALIVTQTASATTYLAYATTVAATLATLATMARAADAWGVAVLAALIAVRAANTAVIRRRCSGAARWFGASEPGVAGDLLVLLSQDRWVRLRGPVDDLKAVTSGQWLRAPTRGEGWVSAAATLLLYAAAAAASWVQPVGQALLLALLVGSVGVVALVNAATDVLAMHGRTVRVEGKPRMYGRRLEMAEELVKEVGREDWAVRLGMINRPGKESEGPPTM